MGYKGSWQRPVKDKKQRDANWDKIFGTDKREPAVAPQVNEKKEIPARLRYGG